MLDTNRLIEIANEMRVTGRDLRTILRERHTDNLVCMCDMKGGAEELGGLICSIPLSAGGQKWIDGLKGHPALQDWEAFKPDTEGG